METSERRTRLRNGSSRRCGIWAARRCKAGRITGSRRQSMICAANPGSTATVKKLSWHTKFGDIAVVEPQFRFENSRVRRFVLSAKVSPRGCSRPLQRAIVDFAADTPFAVVQLKLREHYGFEIGESTIQRITLGHAQAIFEADPPTHEFPQTAGRHGRIVAQMDGGMVPVVEPDAERKDKRKGKKLSWREAKIALAHARGSCTPVYGGGISGGVEAAGQRLFTCAVRAGFGAGSRVHAVGDGAPWIIGQIDELFGEQGSYLIDFYHVCEYLSAAAKAIAPDPAAAKAWMEARKDALRTGRTGDVLSALIPHLEPPDVGDEQAPVRACHRYLDARKGQLRYAEALAEGLPIGSGEIESAHRYVVQKRLKLPGAWWLAVHAEHMIALRINRLNGDWDRYWATLAVSPTSHANLNQRELSPAAA